MLVSPQIEVSSEEEVTEVLANLEERGFNSSQVLRNTSGVPVAVFGVWKPPNKIGGPLLVTTEMRERVPQEWLDWADGKIDEISPQSP